MLMPVYFLLIIIMTLSGAFGSMFFKKTIEKCGFNLTKLILCKTLYIGVLLYLVGAILNIILLKSIDYSILYPMTSLTYIWVMIISYLTLSEKIDRNKIIAVVLIISGVIILNI